ncbi:FabD/lysophospholipase-like protein [Neoconidiobolus thromboides FSU 785]|nr:FabD/lysophospholipase-like protein [Neoconidiobolus thromboides FSU 785]
MINRRSFQSTSTRQTFLPRRWLTSEAGKPHKCAILFPGQGSQYIGMGKDFYDNYQSARDVYHEVDEALNFKLSELIFEGDCNKLKLTENAQPAILTTSIAILNVLQKEFGFDLKEQANFALGHSLGEFSALVATDSIKLSDAAQLVRIRGKAMQNCVAEQNRDVLMSALILSKNRLRDLEDAMVTIRSQLADGEVAEIANINSNLQSVISGTREGVNFASQELKRMKIATRAVDLPVSAPFHCSLMQPSRVTFEEALNKIEIQKPNIPVIFGATGKPIDTEAKDQVYIIKQLLSHQIDSTVQWHYSIQYCKQNSVDRFIAIGPSKVLGNLARKDYPLDWIRCVSTVSECESEFGTNSKASSNINETKLDTKKLQAQL